MKHELLQEVWRIRDEIADESGHDLKRLATLVRKEEARRKGQLVPGPPRTGTRSKRRLPTLA